METQQQPTGEAQNSQKKVWYKKWWVIALGIIILYAIGSSALNNNSIDDAKKKAEQAKQEQGQNADNAKREEPKKEEVIKITAKELQAKYEANEVQADELYKNKTIEVSGTIETIGKDVLDKPYITLETDNSFSPIQCMLADTEKSKAAELKKGQSISLEGKGAGKIMNVILKDCLIK